MEKFSDCLYLFLFWPNEDKDEEEMKAQRNKSNGEIFDWLK